MTNEQKCAFDLPPIPGVKTPPPKPEAPTKKSVEPPRRGVKKKAAKLRPV